MNRTRARLGSTDRISTSVTRIRMDEGGLGLFLGALVFRRRFPDWKEGQLAVFYGSVDQVNFAVHGVVPTPSAWSRGGVDWGGSVAVTDSPSASISTTAPRTEAGLLSVSDTGTRAML